VNEQEFLSRRTVFGSGQLIDCFHVSLVLSVQAVERLPRDWTVDFDF